MRKSLILNELQRLLLRRSQDAPRVKNYLLFIYLASDLRPRKKTLKKGCAHPNLCYTSTMTATEEKIEKLGQASDALRLEVSDVLGSLITEAMFVSDDDLKDKLKGAADKLGIALMTHQSAELSAKLNIK